MYAVIEVGSKQFKVKQDQRISVDNLNKEEGEKITFDKILLISDSDGKTQIGQPNIDNATVEAEVVRNFRDKKIIIFKKRRRQNSRRKRGHRQDRTEIRITAIKQ